MKVLVTGATGFIGKHVVAELLQNTGIQVVATSRNISSNSFAPSPNLTLVNKDLGNGNGEFFSFFGRPDVLIHLAWNGLPNYNKLFHIEENLWSNYFFVKGMVQQGLSNIVIAGTCFEYGMQSGKLHEDLPTAPKNIYGLAKDTLRKFIQALQKSYTFELKWVRLFYPYGPGQSKTSILEQLNAALERNDGVFNMSKGDQLRDYLPVGIMAKYIVSIALQNRIYGVINCCSGEPISVQALVEKFLRDRGRQIKLNLGYFPYPDYEPMAFWGDTTKLSQAICLKGNS